MRDIRLAIFSKNTNDNSTISNYSIRKIMLDANENIVVCRERLRIQGCFQYVMVNTPLELLYQGKGEKDVIEIIRSHIRSFVIVGALLSNTTGGQNVS
jgi:hypothetical protein